jgi:hypothetical protein
LTEQIPRPDLQEPTDDTSLVQQEKTNDPAFAMSTPLQSPERDPSTDGVMHDTSGMAATLALEIDNMFGEAQVS